MTKSSEVTSILSNRHKLTSQPGIFIKADLSPKERLIELLLLKERRSLIESGVDHSGIKIRGNAIYVKKQKHASVINSVLHLANPQHPNHLAPPDDTISVNDLSNANPAPDIPEPCTPPPLSKTSVQSSSQSWLYSLGLAAGTWNACSVVNKLHFLQSLIYCKWLDAFCITETWLTDFVANNEIAPENYTIYHRDRGSRGGVMIAVSNTILQTSFLIYLIRINISVELYISPKILLICLYIPPGCTDLYLQ